MKIHRALFFTSLLLFTACTDHQQKTDESSAEDIKLVQKGKLIYETRCVACHGNQPDIAHDEAPSTYGANLNLLTTKLLNGTYPEGYKPQRSTTKMGRFPDLKDDIEAIFSYLNSNDN